MGGGRTMSNGVDKRASQTKLPTRRLKDYPRKEVPET